MNADQIVAGLSESEKIRRNRRLEARRAGMTRAEAEVFADCDMDVGMLRKLVRGGCPPELLAWILL